MAVAAPPERPRFSRRQEEVLDVVERVFLREGVKGVRMGNLAREASCSLSTLYELAPSKEELLLLVIDRLMRRIAREGWAAVEAETDPAARVHAMLTGGALDASSLGPRFLEAVTSHPPAQDLFDRWMRLGRDALAALVDDAVRAGEFRPVRAAVLVDALFPVALRFSDPTFTRSTTVDTRDALRELVDVLIAGLRTR
jgi:AcrR family transcriptional regulator